MTIIRNSNGIDYHLIGSDGDYSFLISCSRCQFVVAWKLHEISEGLYSWEQGHYFNGDFLGACDCFVKKCVPFDPPYMVY